MYPLPVHTVQLILQYISPLSDPLPPHLISTPLRQRHHFLRLSPSSPAEYLCWPDNDGAKIIDLLDHLLPSSDRVGFLTRYTSDLESTFAHVQISSDTQGLRMLFHWDDTQHGWKYHDLCLMPFPSPSYSTPQESITAGSLARTDPDHPNSGDNDAYWDAYGTAESNLTSPLPPQGDATEGEDAYWAQYASVQGSADSTVPSPLPAPRKFRVVNPTDPTEDSSTLPSAVQNDPIIDIPVDVIHLRPLAPRPGTLSPDTLVHLLSSISPRKDISVIDDPDVSRSSSAYSTDPSQEQTTADSELVTPPMPDSLLDPETVLPAGLKLDGVPLAEHSPRVQAEDAALSDSIKGLYYLWKAGRKGEPDEKDSSVFLRIVHATIECE